jgi:DNA-binding response OmpR family regulator
MRILVIEDQEKLALSIQKGLEHHGYAVDVLFDGSQGLRRIENSEYDLVVLDIMLPGIDGLTICKTVREKGIDVPILMLTAKDTLIDKVEGFKNGTDDYLVKPFDFAELVARIGALLRRPRKATPVEITLNGITLNTTQRTVKRNGKDIKLTTKEFSILEQFMLHPNEVLSRSAILTHAWDFAYDGFSNVVDVHVKNLRKKLQKKHEILFETVHGAGYRFKT